MRTATTPIKMKFVCDQDWNAMTPTAKGRHCAVCKKEVFDFSNKTLAEINAIQNEKTELCGNFLTEQVETHLHPIEFKTIRKGKYWLATVSTFLGLQISSLKAQDRTEIKTEQTDGTAGVSENVKTANVCYIGDDPKAQLPDEQPVKKYKRKKFYWSWRFPFVHRRHYRTMGARF